MKKIALPGLFLSLFVLACAFGPPAQDQPAHPSETSRVLATYTPASSESSSTEKMAEAATKFLAGLNDERRAECVLPLDSPERRNWTNVPPGRDENGVRLGDLAEAELKLACDLLATALSEQGYFKVRDILLADDRLLRGGKPRTGFGAENYWLVIFGKPSNEERWALQLDGHHIAVNLTFEGDRMTMSPSFIGTQPAVYPLGRFSVEPLAGEIEAAVALLQSLSDEQRGKAVLSERRKANQAGAGRDGFVPEATGLDCGTLNEEQRDLVRKLLVQYVGGMPEPFASARMKVLADEIDEMVFAWHGPIDKKSDVSYRLQGPTVIIEYACQDLGGDPLDHLHTIYRDPGNEYGAGFGR